MKERELRYNPFFFFILTFSITWIFWFVAIGVDKTINHIVVQVLFALGGLGPLTSGLYLIYRQQGVNGLRDLRKRLNPNSIKSKWYIVVFSLPPVVAILAIFISQMLELDSSGYTNALDTLSQPSVLVPLIIFLFFFGPLPEEIGWRGYGLDSLQERYSPFLSSMILGSMWSIWHLPLFMIEGSYQNQLGLGTYAMYSYFLSPLVFSFVITWVYNNNNHSTLTAVLLHYMDNLSGELFEPETYTGFLRTMLYAVLVLILISINRFAQNTSEEPVELEQV